MKRHHKHARPFSFEALEPRVVLSASATSSSTVLTNLMNLIYTIDGSGNNLANTTWGEAGADLYRGILAANYADGISALNDVEATNSSVTLPSARLISNLLGNQAGDILDSRNLSAFIYAWGQFIDHDLDLTPDGGASDPISVPAGDPTFSDITSLPFTRSVTDPTTGTSTSNPLNQVTEVTSFLDGSQIYGSDAATAALLRTFKGGQLKTSANDLLPIGIRTDMADQGMFPESDMFAAGDVRANENIELTALQVLFMREHNRQAEILAKEHPTWSDEQLYQGARQIVIAEIQSITFNEYLPALLGSSAITEYSGYNASVNPGISPEFSEAAFRFGHSQLDDDVQFMKADGTNFSFTFTLPDGTQVPVNTAAEIAGGETGISLVEAFFDPYVLEQSGVEDSILKYLSSDTAQAVDTKMVDSVRNILFGDPGSGAGGEDLFALDVQRGRDVGLPTYNEARVAYGLPAVTSFSQITSDRTLQAELKSLYGNVNNVELFVGGIAEDHAKGSSVGATFQAIIANQFERIRDGDRLWYQNIFSGAQLKAIQNTSLADIIRANTNLSNIQNNVFVFKAAISGSVILNQLPSRPGGFSQFNHGAAGITVNLIDAATGEVEATTTTDSRGNYHFDITEAAQYQVQVLLSGSTTTAAKLTRKVAITRGDQLVSDVNFNLQINKLTDTPPFPGKGKMMHKGS